MTASEAKIRTVIVDDEAPARARIRQLLKTEPDIEVVAECANGRQALDCIQRDRPELVFLDVQMPRLTGLEVCEAATAAGAAMPLVIFVTAHLVTPAGTLLNSTEEDEELLQPPQLPEVPMYKK